MVLHRDSTGSAGIPYVPQPMPAQSAVLNLDDVVALAVVIEWTVGRKLSPDESSRLKAAFQASRTLQGGPTLEGMAEHLAGLQ